MVRSPRSSGTVLLRLSWAGNSVCSAAATCHACKSVSAQKNLNTVLQLVRQRSVYCAVCIKVVFQATWAKLDLKHFRRKTGTSGFNEKKRLEQLVHDTTSGVVVGR